MLPMRGRMRVHGAWRVAAGATTVVVVVVVFMMRTVRVMRMMLVSVWMSMRMALAGMMMDLHKPVLMLMQMLVLMRQLLHRIVSEHLDAGRLAVSRREGRRRKR